MALRNQPYLPLYVQDFLTDEKLIECSAESTGVYVRIMCILHKSDEYGCILLKQKDKQTDDNIKNFALKLAKQMPYDISIIEHSLRELLEEKVLTLEEDLLFQKRMRRDGILSDKRAEAGKKGANKKSAKDFAKANDETNTQANNLTNTEIEYEYENEDEIDNENNIEIINNEEKISLEEIKGIIDYLNLKTNSHYKYSSDKTKKLIRARINDGFEVNDFKIVIDNKADEWLGTDFEKFLRPETLFSNKFEGYLNQKTTPKKKTLKDISMSDLDRAIELERGRVQ